MNNNFITTVKNTWENHKKQMHRIVIVIALLAIVAAGFQTMFRVEGVVTGIDNSTITVTSFFRTQTVDLTGAPANAGTIKVGDKIRIQKNLQGNVLYITTDSLHNGKKHGDGRDKNK